MEILRCSHLTKTYKTGSNQVVALDNVDLALEKGSFTAIVGASGSGKSTLLHLLGGVDRPTSGNIYIEDTDISTLNMEELAVFRRRKVGLVYQFYNLIPTLNVRKNILLPILLDGRKPDEARFEQIVNTLGLSDRLSHLPRELWTACQINSPAVSSRGWPLPAASFTSLPSFWPMSPRVIWTVAIPRRPSSF